MQQSDGPISFIPKLKFKPGAKEIVLPKIYKIIDRMSQEPSFISTYVHEDLSNPDTLVLYETWACSKDYFLTRELTKDYRKEYEEGVAEYMHDREFTWLSPPFIEIHCGTRHVWDQTKNPTG